MINVFIKKIEINFINLNMVLVFQMLFAVLSHYVDNEPISKIEDDNIYPDDDDDDYSDKYISILEVNNSKIKIINSVRLHEKFSDIDNLAITNNNIFYDKFTGAYKLRNSYIYNDNKFTKCKFSKREELYQIDDINFQMKDNEDIVERQNLHNYSIVLIKVFRTKKGKILVIDNERCEIIRIELIDNYSNHNFYFYENKLVLIIGINFCDSIDHARIIELDTYGKIHAYDIAHKDVDDSMNLIAETNVHFFDNYIMYYDCNVGQMNIYDYIKREIVVRDVVKGLGGLLGFLKLKEKEKVEKQLTVLEKMYLDDGTKDIEIETNNKTIKAHKIFLIQVSEYFKNIFSGNFIEKNKIVFDVEGDIFEAVLKYIYLGKIEFGSINKLINIYKVCDKIMFNEMKNQIGELMYNTYYIDDKKTQVKIYEKSFLSDLPNTIKTIIFDKHFNSNIDGLIKINVEKLIFGKNFKENINDIPMSVKKILVNRRWRGELNVKNKVELIKRSYKKVYHGIYRNTDEEDYSDTEENNEEEEDEEDEEVYNEDDEEIDEDDEEIDEDDV